MKTIIAIFLLSALSAFAECPSSEAESLCFGLKIAVFSDKKGEPLVTEAELSQTLEEVNNIWKKCSIGFEITEVTPADSQDPTLRFRPAHETDMYVNYERFKNSSALLLVLSGVFTGIQSHSTGYASLPWKPIPGAATIPKSRYNLDPHNFAHELGHVLGLDIHSKENHHVMNAYIGSKSPHLNPADCQIARKFATTVLKDSLL